MPSIQANHFGEVPKHGPVSLFTLTNTQGNRVKITNFGGIVTSIVVQDQEMVIGFDTLAGYLEDNPYYGALIGRYGNRIHEAKFELNGETFKLVANEGGNQLHGGPLGFNTCVWDARTESDDHSVSLVLTHVSPDGDMGFPGELSVTCTYTWTDENELKINYKATSTQDTIVNLTNHSYFTLGAKPTIEGLHLQLHCDAYVPVDESFIPLGELAPVADSPFDFRAGKLIAKDLDAGHPQTKLSGGYDHTFAIREHDGSLKEFAVLSNPVNGRSLRCLTTEPGVQVFTADFGEGDFFQRGHTPFPPRAAICLESQHFPDSPNQAAFATPLLKKGEAYRTTTVYAFS